MNPTIGLISAARLREASTELFEDQVVMRKFEEFIEAVLARTM